MKNALLSIVHTVIASIIAIVDIFHLLFSWSIVGLIVDAGFTPVSAMFLALACYFMLTICLLYGFKRLFDIVRCNIRKGS